jgi:2,4-dienoyl-CoA reductase-like NADH-dependent reductase (Old Yellow Enzyme family)
MPLLDQIERYLDETQLSATRFGRMAVRDPRFVHDLRAGREPRYATRERVKAFLSQSSTNH